MFILVNTILFIAIFGYTAMTLVKFLNVQKKVIVVGVNLIANAIRILHLIKIN